MRMTSKLAPLFLGAVVALATSVANAEQLDVSEGTMTLQGVATANYRAADITKYGGFSGGLDIGFSYFVIDNLAIGFNAMASGTIAGTTTIGNDQIYRKFGLGLGLEYVFANDSIVYPYLGAGAGFAWLPDAAVGNQWWIDVNPKFGMLIGLNRHVSIDLGIMAKINIPTSAGIPITLDAGIGFAGVRAFF